MSHPVWRLQARLSFEVCRPDRANPMPAGTSVAISDAVGSQAVNISEAGLRCSGNEHFPCSIASVTECCNGVRTILLKLPQFSGVQFTQNLFDAF